MSAIAVLSDLDGVLVDSMSSSRRAWAAWGERHGLDGVALQAANHGRPARQVIARLVDASDVEAEAAFVRDAEISDATELVALPGAADVLALPTVAVVTSCELPLALARLEGAGLPVPEVPSPPAAPPG